eukprot:2486175-Pyramimonas_sp.AAC.1
MGPASSSAARVASAATRSWQCSSGASSSSLPARASAPSHCANSSPMALLKTPPAASPTPASAAAVEVPTVLRRTRIAG